MKIKQDKDLNPRLAKEVQGMRGLMAGAAERNEIPERFTVIPHDERPSMIITDTTTNRQTTVPLFAYREVRKVLGDLFE